VTEGVGDDRGSPTGVKPGALTALLQEVAAAPEQREVEPPSLPPGTVIGRFEILRELGRGGFGVVYEARDRDLGRQVAVKVVRPGRITEEEGKVSREAEAIARLAHPNLVTLYDVGQREGQPFLVFELLRGKTLDLKIEEGPLPVQEAVHIAIEVARGLAHAHAEGVIHRDLKPANVFITNKGQVKVLDFGMAHAFGRRRLSGGTPAYMAPEQWEDAPEDERTDVFALGVMLYRMLTGEYPFPEGQGRWSGEPATVRRIDVQGAPDLAELVEKMLDRNPTARPRDGAAVLAALTPIEDRLGAKPADGAPPVHAKRRKATFGDLLAELRRRHVFRVMIAYGVFAFAVLQVTEPIMHGAELPNWVLKAVLVALVLGFPVAVILAWAYDLTAQGVKRTPSAAGPGAPRFGKSRLLLPLAVSATVLAIAAVGAGAWYVWKRAVEHPPTAAVPGAGPSIAVMPFTDMNPGKDQDYFADGIAEEILGALSRVSGLRVPGRSSSFWFKGKNVDPAEIARKLSVTHLLEGTVRRSGSKLRITAEVVKASNGERVWSETYERELTDVFAIQDEIARSVVREFAPVLLARNPPPPPTATTDPEAYRLFLLGRALNARSTPESLRHALEALERSAALDPRFAPTQAFLAVVRGGASMYERGDERDRLRKAGKDAAERTVALDPSSPQGYLARAWYRLRLELDWQRASEDIDRATAIEPGDEGVQNLRALLLASLGRTREAVEAERRSVDLSPLNAVHITNLALILVGDGKLGEAREWARRSLEISPANDRARNILGYVALLEGKPEEALAEFQKGMGSGAKAGTVAALHHLGREQESRDALVSLERNHGDEPVAIAGARAWRGDADGAFAALDRAVEERNVDLVLLNPFPLLRSLRGDPRWKKLLRKMNLPVE
jgi:TolB-like protein/Flp pilus assembly protein TadD/predicted Ser/Thr protein kinase